MESLEPSLLEVDLNWGKSHYVRTWTSPLDKISDIAATAGTPSNYLDPTPTEKTDPPFPTMALSTLPPQTGHRKLSPFPGRDIGWLYCNESELPNNWASIQTPTQTSIQALPFSALGFASCLREGPPDLEALCAEEHRPSKSPSRSVSTAPYSAEIPRSCPAGIKPHIGRIMD